jgi:ABC-type Fe3+/spermidine/putrescine transport system ATPase subunit
MGNTHQPLLQITNVTKDYGTSKIVKNISLEIKENEIVTLLGPSGCGKTTTLRMVSGLEPITAGEITCRGKVLDSSSSKQFVAPHKRNFGMVFQSYAIWPQMSVFENVAYPLVIRKMNKSDIAKEVKRALELVGLGQFADRSPSSLSGGQQQRVAFARAIVYSPDLLLLDEPFSNLDTRLREQMRIEVKDLQERLGLSVLFVTHDQEEALSLSDRIIVLNNGYVEQTGSPIELYDKPNTAFVRDFLGKRVLFSGMVKAISDEDGIVGTKIGDENQLLYGQHPMSAKLAIGDSFFLSVRPEQIVVLPNRVEDSRNNIIPGTIEKLFFTGSQYEAEINFFNRRTISMHIPRTHDWFKGQNVFLSFPKEVSRIWPNEK